MAQMKTPVLRTGSNRGSECVDATKHNSPNNTTATLTFQACRRRRCADLAVLEFSAGTFTALFVWVLVAMTGGGWK